MNNPDHIDIAAAHRLRIGCSQIAQALGLSRFGTAYDLWTWHTGRATRPDISSELRVALGEPMEEVLRPFVEQRLGRSLQRDRTEYLHPELPLVGHVDFRVVSPFEDEVDAICDMKTSLGFGASRRFGEDGTDDVDEDVLLQMHGYMMLTGASRAFVAALVPGPELKIFTIHADAEMAALIEEGIANFWHLVETDTPPDPSTEEEARQRWPLHSAGSTVEVSDTIGFALRELAGVKARIRALEDEEKRLRDLIIPAIADGDTIVCAGQKLGTYRANKPSTVIDWQAISNELVPPLELIARHTTTKPGARILRLAKELSA